MDRNKSMDIQEDNQKQLYDLMFELNQTILYLFHYQNQFVHFGDNRSKTDDYESNL